MSASFFLDTNVFTYSFDASSPKKQRRAKELIGEAVATRKGMVSYQVVQEFFNVALRRFSQPLTVPEAEEYFTKIFRPLLTVHSSEAVFIDALRLGQRYPLSWYDSLIVAAAIAGRCTTLFSEDLQHGQKFGTVQITNPFI